MKDDRTLSRFDRLRTLTLAALTMGCATPALCGTMPLSWTPSADPTVAGYKVCYGTSSGSCAQVADAGLATTYTLTGLTDCTQYYVAVKSYNSGGLDSATMSNEISGFPSPVVTTVVPPGVEAGQSATLTISGSNFASGAAVVSFDARVSVTSTTYVSCTQLQAAVTVSADAAPGPISIDVVNTDRSRAHRLSAFQLTIPAAPSVLSTSPADGATGVPVSTTPAVSFSEAVDPATILPASVLLLGPSGVPVAQAAGSPSLDATGLTATIVPQNGLTYGATYRIQVVGVAGGVRDLQGNLIGSTFVQSSGFTTVQPSTTPSKADAPFWYDDADTKPTIDFLSSSDAPAGAFVTIYGDDFGSQPGGVRFGTVAASIVSWTWRKVVVTVPQGSEGPVGLRTGSGDASNTEPFTVHAGSVRHLDGSARAGGNGSAASPWNTFDAADAGVHPGDFVVVHGGTYTGASTADAVFQADTSGTANNTITYFANPGESVLLDATTTTKQAIRINGTFINFVGFGMGGAKYQGIYLSGADTTAVDCEVKDATDAAAKGQGININGARAKALGNYVHDNYSHGFYAYSTSTEIGYNYIARSGKNAPDSRGHGIQFYVVAPGPVYTNGKIYRNYITTSNRGAITIGSYSSGADVYENILTGNDEQCVYIGYNAQNTTFRNNVCYNNSRDTAGGSYVEIELDASASASGVNVFNNVVTSPNPMKVSAGFAATAHIDNNHYQNATSWSWGGTGYSSLTAWKTASRQDSASASGDPLFTAPASNDFRPASGSPLIDTGNDRMCARTSSGVHCDIGAFEMPTVIARVVPVVTSTSPADGAIGVAASVHPTVSFNQAMSATTITASTIRLLGPGDVPVPQAPGSPSLDASGEFATIIPAAPVSENTYYRVEVIAGASGVKDLDGYAMAALFRHSPGFQTVNLPPGNVPNFRRRDVR